MPYMDMHIRLDKGELPPIRHEDHPKIKTGYDHEWSVAVIDIGDGCQITIFLPIGHRITIAKPE